MGKNGGSKKRKGEPTDGAASSKKQVRRLRIRCAPNYALPQHSGLGEAPPRRRNDESVMHIVWIAACSDGGRGGFECQSIPSLCVQVAFGAQKIALQLPERALGTTSTSSAAGGGGAAVPPKAQLMLAKLQAKLTALSADNAKKAAINGKILLLAASYPGLRAAVGLGSSSSGQVQRSAAAPHSTAHRQKLLFSGGQAGGGGFVPQLQKTPSTFAVSRHTRNTMHACMSCSTLHSSRRRMCAECTRP